MTNPVDLRNFREMTGGDQEIERELFEEFLRSSHKCIGFLEDNCSHGENKTWRQNAHAFKGISLNLGAANLGELCKQAQEGYEASMEDKKYFLNAIKQEFSRVEKYIENELLKN